MFSWFWSMFNFRLFSQKCSLGIFHPEKPLKYCRVFYLVSEWLRRIGILFFGTLEKQVVWGSSLLICVRWVRWPREGRWFRLSLRAKLIAADSSWKNENKERNSLLENWIVRTNYLLVKKRLDWKFQKALKVKIRSCRRILKDSSTVPESRPFRFDHGNFISFTRIISLLHKVLT